MRIGALAAVAATVFAAQPAHAATGKVVTFTHELEEFTVHEDPPSSSCNVLPLGGHLILNQTDSVITLYADTQCVVPLEPVAQVKPGYGTHILGAGSFKV